MEEEASQAGSWCVLSDVALQVGSGTGSWVAVGEMECAESLSVHSELEAPDQKPVPATQLFEQQTGSQGLAALHREIVAGNVEAVWALMDDAAFLDLNACTHQGSTFLHLAASLGESKLVAMLLGKESLHVVNALDKLGQSALHHAAAHGSTDTAQLLLDHPRFTAVNAVDNVGRTALDRACCQGHTELVQLLLNSQRFTKIGATTSCGRTALHSAAWHGHARTAQVLLDASKFAEANVVDTSGKTALHYAASFGHVGVVQVLVAHPRFRVVNRRDKQGWSALDCATEHEQHEVALLLETTDYHEDEEDTAGTDHAERVRCDARMFGTMGDFSIIRPSSVHVHQSWGERSLLQPARNAMGELFNENGSGATHDEGFEHLSGPWWRKREHYTSRLPW